MANEQDELQGWKQRYYDAIGELEEREKQRAQSLQHRLINRL
jgi:hypothetical protein